MWKVGGTKIERTRACYIFLVCVHGNSQKSDFWGRTLRNQKFSTGKLFGAGTYGILTHSGFRKCIWKVGTTNFWPCFGHLKLGESDKMGSISKIMRCSKKQARPQFSEYRSQNESAACYTLWPNADSFWKRYFVKLRPCLFFWTPHLQLFFLK